MRRATTDRRSITAAAPSMLPMASPTRADRSDQESAYLTRAAPIAIPAITPIALAAKVAARWRPPRDSAAREAEPEILSFAAAIRAAAPRISPAIALAEAPARLNPAVAVRSKFRGRASPLRRHWRQTAWNRRQFQRGEARPLPSGGIPGCGQLDHPTITGVEELGSFRRSCVRLSKRLLHLIEGLLQSAPRSCGARKQRDFCLPDE